MKGLRRSAALALALCCLCACAEAQKTQIAVAAPQEASKLIAMVDKPDGGADKAPVMSLDYLTEHIWPYIDGLIPFL